MRIKNRRLVKWASRAERGRRSIVDPEWLDWKTIKRRLRSGSANRHLSVWMIGVCHCKGRGKLYLVTDNSGGAVWRRR